MSRESASDEDMTERCEKPMLVSRESASDDDVMEKPVLVNVVKVSSIFAIDGKGGATYTPNSAENCSLKVRL